MRTIDLTSTMSGGVHVSLWGYDEHEFVVDDVTVSLDRNEALAVARRILAWYGEVQ